jgi:hypothetical protein
MRRTTTIVVVLTLLIASFTVPAAACPSCYGEAQGPVIDGMNNAIGAMIGIVGFVLSGFVVMFIAIGKRTRNMNKQTAPGAAFNQEGVS